MRSRLWLTLICSTLYLGFGCSKSEEIIFAKSTELPEVGKTELHYISAVDYNGDKKIDLVVGNHSGEIAIRVNSGTNDSPVYKTEKNLQTGDRDILIPHW